jgi:pyruvate dehydrogenase E2 component (dihydrolipoamide acetyltransferase)
MSLAVFNLPDVGEGLTEAEIVSWKVAAGDQVSVNQVICEIETAKSIVELPCPFAGIIEKLFAKEGDTVLVGTPIISVQAEGNILAAGPATSSIPILTESDTMHEAVAAVASSMASDEKNQTWLVMVLLVTVQPGASAPALSLQLPWQVQYQLQLLQFHQL